MKTLAVVACALAMAAPMWAADAALDGGGFVTAPGWTAPTPSDQASTELAWDNGTRRWSIAWYTGADSWVGNEFDVSSMRTGNVRLLKFKFYTRDTWPNQQWDGFRIAVYNFQGGVPGSMMWPTSGDPKFFKPSGLSGHVWVETGINWTSPSDKFMPCEEQFYNYPNCDPFSVDTNETFLGHSWKYYDGWAPLSTSGDPYRNLMLRVWVEMGPFPSVEPTSIGRVKALYY